MRLPMQSILLIVGAIAACSNQDAKSGDSAAIAAAAAWSDAAPHNSGFVNASGVRLHYLDWGGSGPNLILIHGYGDNPHVFDDIASAFTDSFRVVAYARRGHGRSGKAGPFDTATLTADLRELMDSLRIDRAHLAGWSMGGNEITAMAGRHPERVDRLVYLDAAYDWADPVVAAAFDSLPVNLIPTADALVSLDTFRGWQRRAFFPAVSDTTRLEAYVRDLVDLQSDGTVRPVMSDSVAQAIFSVLVSDRRDYSKVKAPALAIYSETFLDVAKADSAQRAKNLAWENKFFAPFREASIARVRREIPGIEIVRVPGTHPDFVFTSRDKVVEAMRRFLGAKKGTA
ncbi:MAG: alpha/beta fold hydrolase [Gemmatimonadaceae bacterium]